MFEYDPATGELRNRVARGHRARPGALVGTLMSDVSLRVRIEGRGYQVDQVVWLIAYGEWPPALVGHKNGIRSDNRLSNLRPSTRSQSLLNAKLARNNSSGVKGVCWSPRDRKWRAVIVVGGRQRWLGEFVNMDDAAAARQAAGARVSP